MKTNRVIAAGITLMLLISAFEYVRAQSGEFRTIENNAFTEGEVLTFDIRYGFVTAGVAELSIPKIKKITGRDVYHVTLKVNSLPSFDWIYKVRTRYETYIDVEGLFPWRFEQHIRESKFTNDFSAFFDQRRGIAKTTEGTYEMPRYTQDILSAFYYARTLDYSSLEKGDKLRLRNFYNDKVHDLDVVYLGKETITVNAGTFDCIIVEPLVLEGGFFKNKGSIVIWLTDDELRIPVMIQTKVVVGSIDIELAKYEGLAGELESLK